MKSKEVEKKIKKKIKCFKIWRNRNGSMHNCKIDFKQLHKIRNHNKKNKFNKFSFTKKILRNFDKKIKLVWRTEKIRRFIHKIMEMGGKATTLQRLKISKIM